MASMTTTASVTVSYLYGGDDTISVTASCQGYPDAIADARAQAVRALLEIVDDLARDDDDDEPAEAAADDQSADD